VTPAFENLEHIRGERHLQQRVVPPNCITQIRVFRIVRHFQLHCSQVRDLDGSTMRLPLAMIPELIGNIPRSLNTLFWGYGLSASFVNSPISELVANQPIHHEITREVIGILSALKLAG